MNVPFVHCVQCDAWVTVGESITIEMKRKNKKYNVNGIITSIKANSITVNVYESTVYSKKFSESDTSKLAGLNFLVLSQKVIVIRPENIVRTILVAHVSFFRDLTLPFHRGLEYVFAIEKKRVIVLKRKKFVQGTSKVLRSEFSPIPEANKFPIKDITNAYSNYQLRCTLRFGFFASISKKGGWINRSFTGIRISILDLNYLFTYCQHKENSISASCAKKTAKLREERGMKVCFS
jgi:hypothetical protein